MKAGLLAIAAFSAVVVALPHAHLHEKRDVEVVYATQVEVVTATAPAAYVYVDQNGNAVEAPASTPAVAPVVNGKWGGEGQGHEHGHGQDQPAPAQATPTPAPVVQSPAPVVEASSVAPVAVSIPAVVIPPVASSVAPVAGSSESGVGIAYSPYTTKGGPCRSADQVASEIKALSQYSTIRLYGTDCNQIAHVLPALAPEQKVVLGIFFIDRASLDGDSGEIATLRKEVNGQWGKISAITVGNELVNEGKAAADVLSSVGYVRSALADVYSGPVSTADTVNAFQTSPSLCTAGDSGNTKGAIYANIHPYFNPATTADVSGPYVLSQIALVKVACGLDRTVIVSETGWPTAGGSNGVAQPGVPQQAAALKSLKSSLPSGGYYLLSAHDEEWKDASMYNGVEQHWGLASSS